MQKFRHNMFSIISLIPSPDSMDRRPIPLHPFALSMNPHLIFTILQPTTRPSHCQPVHESSVAGVDPSRQKREQCPTCGGGVCGDWRMIYAFMCMWKGGPEMGWPN